MADRFGISRTPIRDILHRLEQEDLVRQVPNKGTFVSELTPKDIEEVLEIRMAIEPAAARSAATRLTEQHVIELREIIRQLDGAVKLQDSITSFEAASRLHNLILVAAGNARAHRIINNLIGQIQRIRFMSGRKPGRVITTADEQRNIVHALLGKDPAMAENAMRVHLTNAKRLLLRSPGLNVESEEFAANSVPS